MILTRPRNTMTTETCYFRRFCQKHDSVPVFRSPKFADSAGRGTEANRRGAKATGRGAEATGSGIEAVRRGDEDARCGAEAAGTGIEAAGRDAGRAAETTDAEREI